MMKRVKREAMKRVKREATEKDDPPLMDGVIVKLEPRWSMEEGQPPAVDSPAQPMADSIAEPLLSLKRGHVCQHCSAAFMLVSSLELHMASFHGEPLSLTETAGVPVSLELSGLGCKTSDKSQKSLAPGRLSAEVMDQDGKDSGDSADDFVVMAAQPSTSGDSEPGQQTFTAEQAVRLILDKDEDDLQSDDSLEHEDGDDSGGISDDIRQLLSRAVRPSSDAIDSDTSVERASADFEYSESDSDSDGQHERGAWRACGVRRGRGRGRGRGVQERSRSPVRGHDMGRGRATQRSVPFTGDLVPPNRQQPVIPNFTGDPGLKVQRAGDTCFDFFKLFVTDELIDLLVAETNRYAQQTIQAARQKPGGVKKYSRLQAWTKTTADEMRIFIGMMMLTGLVKKPTLPSYWSTNPLLSSPVFPHLMTRNRFQLLLRFWHCCDDSQEPARDDPQRDRLFKVRPLVSYLQEKFQTVYKPEERVAIDESLLLWKGRLVFRQYIPLKRARFGIKMYRLCEASGYTYRFHVYSGKQEPSFQMENILPDDAQHLTMSEKVVVYMMGAFDSPAHSLLGKGYKLFFDNWYSGVNLFRYLYQKQTTCCGTAKASRVPQQVRDLPIANTPAAMDSLRCEELLFIKWQSSKVVFMMSTMHDESTRVVERRGHRKTKPSCVVDYNSYMGAVDKTDAMLQPYDATRKMYRWYKKLMLHLLQISCLNAFLVYQKTVDMRKDFFSFQTDVIYSLVSADKPLPADAGEAEEVSRLFGRHFPSHVPAPPSSSRKWGQKRCRVCGKHNRRTDTSVMCAKCPDKPGLCIDPCFQLYHTIKNY